MSMDLATTRRLADLREEKSQEISRPAFSSRYIRFGEFLLDLQRQDLIKKGERLRIPGKVCQVLTALLEHPGEVVTREDLRARLWTSDTHVNFDANVNTTVNKLRQLLGDSNEQSVYVQTIPRRGYSFIGQLAFVDQADDSSVEDSAAGEPSSANAIPGAPAASSSTIFAPHRSRVWFTAGVIALTIAAMLLGAAITLFSYHHS